MPGQCRFGLTMPEMTLTTNMGYKKQRFNRVAVKCRFQMFQWKVEKRGVYG